MNKPKHEPWYKPRADEDADEELINWLGGGGNKKPPAKKKGGGGFCGILVLAGLASFAAVAAGAVRVLA